ncbi:MAG: DUF3347 domain-containing protein [Flavobacteriales bacterium]|nr:DUF3347 domain-containing protein [Flavobacteriales bacterium]
MRTALPPIITLLLLAITSCSGVKNARTETVRINGNCGMCEATIEEAGLQKGLSQVDWDKGSRDAVLTFDSTRTTADAMLRRIAEAGYDNQAYLAPDAVYEKLPLCCHYERTGKHIPVNPDPGHKGGMHAHQSSSADMTAEQHEHGADHLHGAAVSAAQVPAQTIETFAEVFKHYFALKDALIAGDKTKAKEHAEGLDGAMHSVDAEVLPADQQGMWTEVMTAIMPHLHPLSETTDLAKQRELFAKLTAPMAQLAKAAPQAQSIYLDHCPMFNGGSDWLSTDKAIKNPFYGSAMLTCGSVKETIGGK